jgi:ribosomal protein L44E
MSCINCKFHKGDFKTEQSFHEFDMLLQYLVNDGKFKYLGEKKATRFFELRYQCQYCNTIWTLSIPDQAFRGGWNEEQ